MGMIENFFPGIGDVPKSNVAHGRKLIASWHRLAKERRVFKPTRDTAESRIREYDGYKVESRGFSGGIRRYA